MGLSNSWSRNRVGTNRNTKENPNASAITSSPNLETFYTHTHTIRSLAIGDDGTIYAGADDTHLIAINPDGTKKWSLAIEGMYGYSPSSITVGSDGTIYTSRPSNSGLTAVNPDGTKKWRITLDHEHNGTIRPASFSTEVAVDNNGDIYTFYSLQDGKDRIIRISPTGSIVWDILFPSTTATSHPVAINDSLRRLYHTDYYYLYTFDMDTGNLISSTIVDANKGTSEVLQLDVHIAPDGTVVVLTDDRYSPYVFGFTSEGSHKWRYDLPLDHYGSSGLLLSNKDEFYFTITKAGTWDDYRIVCLDASDGTFKWKTANLYNATTNEAYTNAVVKDGFFYVCGYDANWNVYTSLFDNAGNEKWRVSNSWTYAVSNKGDLFDFYGSGIYKLFSPIPSAPTRAISIKRLI